MKQSLSTGKQRIAESRKAHNNVADGMELTYLDEVVYLYRVGGSSSSGVQG